MMSKAERWARAEERMVKLELINSKAFLESRIELFKKQLVIVNKELKAQK